MSGAVQDVWAPVAGTRYFTRNGKGLYERLTPRMYLRVDDLEESDEVECCAHFVPSDPFIERAQI